MEAYQLWRWESAPLSPWVPKQHYSRETHLEVLEVQESYFWATTLQASVSLNMTTNILSKDPCQFARSYQKHKPQYSSEDKWMLLFLCSAVLERGCWMNLKPTVWGLESQPVGRIQEQQWDQQPELCWREGVARYLTHPAYWLSPSLPGPSWNGEPTVIEIPEQNYALILHSIRTSNETEHQYNLLVYYIIHQGILPPMHLQPHILEHWQIKREQLSEFDSPSS